MNADIQRNTELVESVCYCTKEKEEEREKIEKMRTDKDEAGEGGRGRKSGKERMRKQGDLCDRTVLEGMRMKSAL